MTNKGKVQTRSKNRVTPKVNTLSRSKGRYSIPSDFTEAKMATVILDVAVNSVDADEYLSEIVRLLTDHLRCSYAGVVLFDDDASIGCISCYGSIEFQRIPRTIFPTSDKCICSMILSAESGAPSFRLTKAGSIFRNHKPTPDKSVPGKRGNGSCGLCIGNNIESAALVPIKCRGTIEGILIVADEHKNTLPLKTVESLERFACYLGITFKSLRVRNQASHQSLTPVTKESEHATRKSGDNELMTLLMDNSNESILISQDWRIVYVNRQCARLAGMSQQDMIGMHILDLTHPDDRETIRERYTDIVNNRSFPESVTSRGLDKDGDVRWAEVRGIPFSWNGRFAVLSLINDITERKRAEENLRASEDRFRAIIEHSRDAIAILDGDYRATFESASLKSVTGYEPEEWIGKSINEMSIHPDDLAALASKLEILKNQPGLAIEDVTVRYRHKDGSWRVIEASARNLLHDPKVKGIVVNYRDVTHRKQMESALEESERKYRTLAEQSLQGIMIVQDIPPRIIYCNNALANIIGFTVEEILSMTSEQAENLVHPDDRIMFFERYLAIITGAPTEQHYEFRTVHKNGAVLWFEIFASRIEYEGQPAMQAALIDITERKRAVEALMNSEQRYRFLAENVSDVIWVTDMNLKPTFFSPSVTRLLGCSIEEAMDGTLDSKLTPDSAMLARSIFEEALVREKKNIKSIPCRRTIELEMIRKDGSTVWTETTVSFLRSSDGELFGVLGVLRDITERRKAEQALRDSERRYRLLAENITDVIWTTDMDLRVTYVSPSAVRLVGFTSEELMNMTAQDILTPGSFEHGTKLLAQQKAIRDTKQDDSPHIWTAEVDLCCKDGSTVCVEVKVTFLQDHDGKRIGLLGVTRDITEHKRMEKALRLSEQKYRTIVEASPDGIISVDHNGIITDCNTGLCRLLGYEREELCGSNARKLGTKKDLDMEAQFAVNLNQDSFMEFETEVVRKDGQTSPVWAKLVKLPEPTPANIQTIVYLRDITDRKKIDQMKDEFIGLVSHELRSPLTVIIGAINTAISEGPRLSQKEVRQLLLDASLEADQLSHLVGNLLELSRAQVNRLLLHVEPVDLSRVVHKVSNTVQRRSPKHHFIIDLPKRMPPVVADQLRLERILYNLLENSVKYSPDGSKTRISAKCDDNHVVVAVSDQGPGISPEDQARLFRPFQQLGNPITDHTKGAGLGLLVCRRLVEAHGGRIWVESELNHGSTFYFTLNLSTNQNVWRHRQ